ncbi:DUF4244 domain-containing protein [Amycolatopsis sp. YIM 10]|uniref:DUF4244 domain-containing protein n=1 Tax=Amycolatopsis sp. YIM 10 TaxID=2653857 RepID=UPI00128FD41C|nr:DUF4244 domain-containing protein [Amycolatopsis sp. YIM 10]QFU85701.1 hypothetical protein YIM_02375 [Amycolatopsis sp. YIM 10]
MILSEVRPDAGAVSVEYVLVTLVVVALAGVLFDVVTGGVVQDLLASLVESALEKPK